MISCRVDIEAAISPSEEPQRVVQAVSNMLPCEAVLEQDCVRAVSDLGSLAGLRQAILARQAQGSLRRNLLRNAAGNNTWFYLNRQAAFAGVPAVCDDADESPLGPIRVMLESSRLEEAILWLAAPPDRGPQ